MTGDHPLGVGLVGCGAAGQSIHTTTVQSLPELFSVRHCMDPDPGVAREVAERLGGHGSSELSALLDDPAVEVVVIASPDKAHADQVVAACAAGKKAILCEKPLATSVTDAERVHEASVTSGVPVLVGTMHRHDPALKWLVASWDGLPGQARLVRSRMLVAPNASLVAAVSQPVAALPPVGGGTPWAVTDLDALRALTWGLAVHHLPLLRLVVRDLDDLEVNAAVAIGMAGYLVTLRTPTVLVQLVALINDYPRTEWAFEVCGPERWARVDFPDGFLPNRSATAVLGDPASGEERRWAATGEGGYRELYRNLADVAHGRAEPLTGAQDAVMDSRLLARIVHCAGSDGGVR